MTTATQLRQRAPGDRRQRLTDRRASGGAQTLEGEKQPPQLYVVRPPLHPTDVDGITLGEQD